MIDFYAHFAVLDLLQAQLDQSISSGELNDDRCLAASDALNSDYAYAVLGSVIEHLLAHDGTSDIEIEFLEKANGIWVDARSFHNDFRDVRERLERVAANPTSSSAFDEYNNARRALGDLIPRYELIVARLYAYKLKLETLTHLT